MSVVIIGGNDRMHRLYKDVCKDYGYKAKVFTQMQTDIKKKIGNPDLLILFTNTVSHKMVNCALCEAKKCNMDIERCHSSSISALHNILAERNGKIQS
ncbi:MAG: DUF2325 domain-containing protein [Oscillospiraceae bacterium]